MKSKLTVTVLSCSLVLAACGGGGGGGGGGSSARNVQVSWTANRESAVKSTSREYKVSTSPSARSDNTTPPISNFLLPAGATPTSTNLTLTSGTHHIKVVAYSTLNTTGSAPSAEIAVTVP